MTIETLSETNCFGGKIGFHLAIKFTTMPKMTAQGGAIIQCITQLFIELWWTGAGFHTPLFAQKQGGQESSKLPSITGSLVQVSILHHHY